MSVDVIAPWLEEIARETGLGKDDVAALVTRPPERSMGDWALPCFRFAKALRKSPQEIAAGFASSLEVEPPVQRIEASGPYLNFFLDRVFRVEAVLGPALSGGLVRKEKADGAPPVVVEYSSPNIAKPFGVGHLRSTVIGNALARLFEASGREVVRLNFPGDWGTQFGLMLAMWTDEGLGNPADYDITKLLDVYVRANKRQDEDEEFKARARGWFRKLEEGDREAVALWEAFRKRSLEEFGRIYGLLGVDAFDADEGEAFIARRPEWVERVLDRASAKGVAKKSEGALIIDLEEFGMPPVLLLKSDGTTTYHTRDLAAALYRWEKYRFDRMLYVVGRDQSLHFRQVAKALEILDMEPAGRIEHIAFGLIRFGRGKMSTRAGNVVMLEDVIASVIERVRGIVVENNPELPAEAVEEVSRQVGVGAVVFEDLGRRRIKDVDFDWERALNLHGDTGPYLQYTYARLRSIERKASEQGEGAGTPDFSLLDGDEENDVLDQLERLPGVFARAVDEREPAVLASGLLSLAAAANRFYNGCRVIGEAPELASARLALVRGVAATLGSALRLLGIPAPERM